METEEQVSLQSLTEMIEYAELGPTSSVGYLGDVIRIELDGSSPRKAQTAQRWLRLIRLRDMTVGKFQGSDDAVFLNLRGRFPSGAPVVIAVPYSERTEPGQVGLIAEVVESQAVYGLVSELAVMERRGS